MATLFTPYALTDHIQLEHRCVLAPLTRNRASKSNAHPRTWVPNELMSEYYTQRATRGGLLITEATPVTLRASGMLGAPGIFTDEQIQAWKPIVKSAHAKGAYFVCQLFHQGRGAHSDVSGSKPESSSAVPISGYPHSWAGIESSPYEVPEALSKEGIRRVQKEFVTAAEHAMQIGFDLIEIHAGNGYLFDQFHHTNINQRTDEYGGSIENRSRFTLETVEQLCSAIGSQHVAVRLSPYAFFNEAKGEQRLETWTYLCQELSKMQLAYVHLIEPRFDEIRNEAEKLSELGVSDQNAISLKPFRKALGQTPLIVAGGYNHLNHQEGLINGEYDLVAFGRFFTSNPDLVDKLRTQQPLYHYQRKLFYGPFEDNSLGYVRFENLRYSGKEDVGKAQLAD